MKPMTAATRLSVLAAVTMAAVALIWVPPLLRAHGAVLGHYRIREFLVGVPVTALALLSWTALLSPPNRRRERVLRLALVFGSIGLTWCVSDAVYMVVTHDPGPNPARGFTGWNRSDPELGYVRVPLIHWTGRVSLNPFAPRLEYRTDEQGFRNPAGIRKARIAVVGDSMVEAGDVAEEATFCQLVGRRLGVTAVNFGRGGYGPQQELKVLERYALSYGPSLVVWVLFEGNDLTDAVRYEDFLRDPAAIDVWPNRPPDKWEAWTTASLTLELLRQLTDERCAATSDKTCAVFAAKERRPEEVSFYFKYLPTEPLDNPVGWNATRQALRRGAELTQREGARLLVAFIPTKHRVMAPYVVFREQSSALRAPETEPGSPDRSFEAETRRLCESAGLEFVSATRALREASSRGELVYFAFDEHLNSAGNAVMADVLARAIEGKGLLHGSPRD
jgi:hypothetical protein